MTKNQEFFKKLTAPFINPDGTPAVHYRILSKKGSMIAVVPYLKGIQIVERLNEVCGIDGWSSISEEFGASEKGIICRITINPPEGNPIERDGMGTPSNESPLKGMHTDALKRAALGLGIGMHEKKLPTLYLKKVKTDTGIEPGTDEGIPLLTAEAITSYINQKHPLRHFFTTLYYSIPAEKQKALGSKFNELWKAITF